MLCIGEAYEGSAGNAAHVSLLLGTKELLGGPFAAAAASPGRGHVPFQIVLKPNLPVKPATLFISKMVLRDAKHEQLAWGPAQLGVAAGLTRALLEGVLPAAAADDWLAIALVWVDWTADDPDSVYANNKTATFLAARRALTGGWPSRAELAAGLATLGNLFYTPQAP